MTKDFKMPIIKDLMTVHYNGIDKKFAYFCDIYFQITTDNIISGHTRILGISYKFWNT